MELLLLLSAKLLKSSAYPKGESSTGDLGPLPAAIACCGVIFDGSIKKIKFNKIKLN